MDTSEGGKTRETTHQAWKKIPTETPQYQKIAWDIATRIAAGELAQGERLHARSGIAGQYGVSTETARRAICILDDLGIVKAVQGSGVVVVSTEAAARYVRSIRDYQSLGDLREKLLEQIGGLREDARALCEQLDGFMERVGSYKASNPFVPFHCTLPEGSKLIGRTLSDLNFRHHTQATVVAIRREDSLLLSPGPHMPLQAGDVLYYIGGSECVERVAAMIGT